MTHVAARWVVLDRGLEHLATGSGFWDWVQVIKL